MNEQWFNFATGEYEVLPNDMLALTDEQARQYILQSDAAQNMFSAFRALDLEPWRALLGVLHAQAGDPLSLEALQALSATSGQEA